MLQNFKFLKPLFFQCLAVVVYEVLEQKGNISSKQTLTRSVLTENILIISVFWMGWIKLKECGSAYLWNMKEQIVFSVCNLSLVCVLVHHIAKQNSSSVSIDYCTSYVSPAICLCKRQLLFPILWFSQCAGNTGGSFNSHFPWSSRAAFFLASFCTSLFQCIMIN